MSMNSTWMDENNGIEYVKPIQESKLYDFNNKSITLKKACLTFQKKTAPSLRHLHSCLPFFIMEHLFSSFAMKIIWQEFVSQ